MERPPIFDHMLVPLNPNHQTTTWNSETIPLSDLDSDGCVDVFIPFDQDSDKRRNQLLLNGGVARDRHLLFNEAAEAFGVAGDKRQDPEAAQLIDFDANGYLDLFVGGNR